MKHANDTLSSVHAQDGPLVILSIKKVKARREERVDATFRRCSCNKECDCDRMHPRCSCDKECRHCSCDRHCGCQGDCRCDRECRCEAMCGCDKDTCSLDCGML